MIFDKIGAKKVKSCNRKMKNRCQKVASDHKKVFAIVQILIVKKCLSLIDESAFILIVKNQGPWQKRKGKDLDLEKINPTLVAPDLDHKKRSRDIGKIRTKDQKVFVIKKFTQPQKSSSRS